MAHLVTFQPSGRRLRVRHGMTVLEAAHKAGEDIRSECGGREKCGKCEVIVDGTRARACETPVDRDMTVAIPEESRGAVQVILHEGSGVTVELDPPALDRLKDASTPALGLALDVGTTTVVGYLVDLKTGKTLSTASLMNPQIAHGEDVMARISHAMKHGVGDLHREVVGGCNRIIEDVCRRASADPADIMDITAVGNTAMHHMFLGLDPSSLGVAPFRPAMKDPFDGMGADIGLNVSPSATLHALPNVDGFIGADNVGAIIATEMHKMDEMTLLMDIGTNGEIVLGNRDGLLAASCATGPAFEGGHIKAGMRAAPGAIEHVDIDGITGELRLQVIGGGAPRGICGSGVVDLVAHLLRAGILNPNGGFIEGSTPFLRHGEDGMEMVLAKGKNGDMVFTGKDVSEVRLARAALSAGTRILLDKAGIKRPDGVLLAGAFGSRMHKESALHIGLLPDVEENSIKVVGNAAGDGARLALLSRQKRREARGVAEMIRYTELTLEPDFEAFFVSGLSF